MRPVARAAIALGSAYAAAAAWVVLADRVFHNQVPADRFEIHGLYPAGLALAALGAALVLDRGTSALAVRRCSPRAIAIAAALGGAPVAAALLANLALGVTGLAASPRFDRELQVVGFPVLLVLGLFEELLWRGYLHTTLREVFSFRATAAIVGLAWGLWHVPVIVHTRFLYADLAPLHGALAILALTGATTYVAAALREASGSVWPSVVWHAAWNYVAFAWVIPAEQATGSSSVWFKLDTGVVFVCLQALLGVGATRWVRARALSPA